MIVLGNADSTCITVISSSWYSIFANETYFFDASLVVFIQKSVIIFRIVAGFVEK